jgi:predicted cobalt transporter CbtA
MPYSEKEKDEFYGGLTGATAKAPCQCEECWKKEDSFAVLKIFLAIAVILAVGYYVVIPHLVSSMVAANQTGWIGLA